MIKFIFTIFIFAASIKAQDLRPFLNKYCSDCHDSELEKAGFNIEKLDYDISTALSQKPWSYAYDMVSTGEMPPKSKKKQPTVEERKEFLKTLSGKLFAQIRERHSKEGRTVFRRLTAEEYENTLIDLLKIPTLRVKSILPNDRSTHEFDNISHAQDLSYVQINSYMEAAEHALEKALFYGVKPEIKKYQIIYENGKKLPVGEANSQISSNGGLYLRQQPTDLMIQNRWISFSAPFSGYYKLNFKAYSARLENKQELPADRKHMVLMARGRHQRFNIPVDVFVIPENKCDDYLGGRYYLDAGNEFIFKIATMGSVSTDQAIRLKEVNVEGPFYDEWPVASQKKLFSYSRSTKVWDENSAVAKPEFLSTNRHKPKGSIRYLTPAKPLKQGENLIREFAAKAFRYPVDKIEIDKFVYIFKRKYENGFCFQDSIKVAYQAILCSPYFLYFHEKPGRLDDFALASRLSYFLWKSMPDVELRELALEGKLRNKEILSFQVERMIEDPKFNRFIKSFTDQWLSLSLLNATSPDEVLYPEFDTWLFESMPKETYAYVRELVKKNLGPEFLIDSDFVMVNERLATLYGIEGVEGNEIRQVKINNKIRGGLITQASLMKVTANGSTTSPVNRGVWFYEKILGKRIPPPPPVGSIMPDVKGATTLREELAKHRANKSCATCHDKFDYLGFALESFDVIGGYRETYRSTGKGIPSQNKVFWQKVKYKNSLKVDSSGLTLDGNTFADVKDLKRLLIKQRALLAENLVKKLLEFSTGAEIEFSDRQVITKILAESEKENYGFKTLIHKIVESDVFQNK